MNKKIKIVFFDFDGTLTSRLDPETTWERIWINLGYDIRICQMLHRKFDLKEISHNEWFDITLQKFKEKRLKKEDVIQVASSMRLIKGIEEVFTELRMREILIYIVSGSIVEVIQTALGDLCQFVEKIQANQFIYDQNECLKEIISTRYDFEGKANFIREVLGKLNIKPEEALFIGNSDNDRFVYETGVKTICINPHKIDEQDNKVWGNVIEKCEVLTDIYQYF